MMNRRDFIKRVATTGGIVGLMGIGLSYEDAQAAMNTYVAGYKEAASGGSCTTQEYTNLTGPGDNNGDVNMDIKDGVTTTLVGGDYTPGSNISVCAVTFYISRKDADVSANTYHAEIWSASGGSLSAQQGSDSTGIQGSNAWGTTAATAEALKFEFSSSISLTGSTTYWFLVTHDQTANSGTECELWCFSTGSGNRATINGSNEIYDTSGGPKMIIWTD